MDQDPAREDLYNRKGVASQEDYDEEETKVEAEGTNDSDKHEREIAGRSSLGGSTSNLDNDKNVRKEEGLRGPVDQPLHGLSETSKSSSRNGRESLQKEHRDRPIQEPSSKTEDETSRSRAKWQEDERLSNAISQPSTKSQGQSRPYHAKDYAYDEHHKPPNNRSGQESRGYDENSYTAYEQYSSSSRDKYSNSAYQENSESCTVATKHDYHHATSKGDSNKQKSGYWGRSKPEETPQEKEKREFISYMRRDPYGAWDRLMQELEKWESQSIKWERQSNEWEARVNLLSQEMLAGRDRFQPVTDGVLTSGMNKLREDVKTLSRELSPKHVSDETFSSTLEGKQLSLREVEKLWTKNPYRSPLLQSSIWYILLTHMFNTPFAVFGTDGIQADITWRTLFGKPSPKHEPVSNRLNLDDQGLDGDEDEVFFPEKPEPEELCEKWKSMTATRLKDKVAVREKSGFNSIGKDTKAALQKILIALSVRTNQPNEEPSWVGDLKNVLHSAAELAMLMAQQRSRLELFIPDLQKMVDSRDSYCDGKTIDVDEGVEGPLNGNPFLVVAPGLRKWGDGLGGKLDFSVDLEAAHVKCERTFRG